MVWNSLRFKPPPSSDEHHSLGWRIEFRPMELQLNDFENAAFAVFLSLLTRAILSYRIDLRMPISLVRQNMDQAQLRNTIRLNQFHFPTNEHRIQSMTIDQIINGYVCFAFRRNHLDRFLFEGRVSWFKKFSDQLFEFIGEYRDFHTRNSQWIY